MIFIRCTSSNEKFYGKYKPHQILNFFSPNEKERKKRMVGEMLPGTGKAFDFVRLSNSKTVKKPEILSVRRSFAFPSRRIKLELPKAWLYRTLRNLSISFCEKNGRIQNSADEEQLDFLESMNENKQASMLSD